jgi:hypothetical protein
MICQSAGVHENSAIDAWHRRDLLGDPSDAARITGAVSCGCR